MAQRVEHGDGQVELAAETELPHVGLHHGQAGAASAAASSRARAHIAGLRSSGGGVQAPAGQRAGVLGRPGGQLQDRAQRGRSRIAVPAGPPQQRAHFDRDVTVGARGLVELRFVIDSRHATMMPDADPPPPTGGQRRQRALAARRRACGRLSVMMTESQALEALTRQDPEAAGDAKAALAWLTGDEGLEVISLLRLQEFLWYALPVKWPMSTPGRVGVAKALGRLFMLAGLDRYAGVCSSAGTERIITAYAAGHEEGIAAYTEAIEASNAAPPDTDLLAWGSVMGPQERAAYDACAAAIELAFASGELSVGARGWRTKRVDLVNRWLTGRSEAVAASGAGRRRHRAGADGSLGTDTWLGRISAERIDAWAHGRPGERSRLARSLIPRLLEPPPCPTTRCPRCAGCSATRTRGSGSPPGTTSPPRWSPRRSTRSAGATSSSAPCARNWTCSRCTPCAAWRRPRWAPSGAAAPAWC